MRAFTLEVQTWLYRKFSHQPIKKSVQVFTIEVYNAFEFTYLRITDKVASYHGLSGHQRRSQGLFPNAERLIGFLLQSISLRQERSTGNEVQRACIIVEFSNSTGTNSFHMVGSRESSSQSTEEEHSSQRIVCLHYLKYK